MSFFSRLKDRLFKSSSKLDEGVEALMESGEEAASPDPGAAAADRAATGRDAAEPENPGSDPQEEAPRADDAAAGGAPQNAPQNARQDAPRDAPRDAPQDPPRDATPARPDADPTPPDPSRASEAPGFAARMMGALTGRRVEKTRLLDDAMLEELEELLIQTDLGVETAMKVAANIAEGRFGRRIAGGEVKRLLAGEIARILEPAARPLPLYAKKPQVVLVVGVNGSGKTTTIGKLASQLKGAGKSVMIAAGDTFRAAAVEQLSVWGERAGVPVFKMDQGTDPASLAFDALKAAQEQHADVLLIDTAGRLQNRQDLMQELSKIVRVLRKRDETAPHNTILVLDATTGQNAIGQAEEFRKIADVTGLVMTKLDGTARGGVLVGLADKTGLPIHAIGVGEAIDDLQPFDPKEFAAALTGAPE